MRRICLLLIAAAAAWYVPAVQAADYETWLQAPLAVRDQTRQLEGEPRTRLRLSAKIPRRA